jgi:hypothetical protein
MSPSIQFLDERRISISMYGTWRKYILGLYQSFKNIPITNGAVSSSIHFLDVGRTSLISTKKNSQNCTSLEPMKQNQY